MYAHRRRLRQRENEFTVVLIGLPDVLTLLGRSPRFIAHLGARHQFAPLQAPEAAAILARQWHAWGLERDPADDAEVMARILRVADGNFRRITKLCTIIEWLVAPTPTRRVTRDIVAWACHIAGYATG